MIVILHALESDCWRFLVVVANCCIFHSKDVAKSANFHKSSYGTNVPFFSCHPVLVTLQRIVQQ